MYLKRYCGDSFFVLSDRVINVLSPKSTPTILPDVMLVSKLFSSNGSITEKQMRKIWAVGRNLGYAKEDLEKKAGKGLSQLTKKEASRLISELLSEEDVEVLYG